MIPANMVGNGLAQRFGGGTSNPMPMPVRGAPVLPIGAAPRPMPTFGSNPPIGRMPPVTAPVQGPIVMPVGGMPRFEGGPIAMPGPSGTALPNSMNTVSPQVGNALRRYLGRAY